ncbi:MULTISPECIES: hypothetical protein [Streptomyces]|uniref:hypothetical protein n=1 Tax=Streptomyces TaxID=1883 RepID=UPI000A907BA3
MREPRDLARSSAAARQSVPEIFPKLGTTGEGIERYRDGGAGCPPEADLSRILKLLEHGAAEGWWHWAEGRVTAAWRSMDTG